MISLVIDTILITALVVTSGCVLLMYQRLKRFDALQGDAAKAFAAASEALEQARRALHGLQTDGDTMAVALANRLNEARMVLNELDDTLSTRNRAGVNATPSPPPAPPPVVRRSPPATEPAAESPPTMYVHGDPDQADPRAPATRWSPPAAKIKAVASSNKAKQNAPTAPAPAVTWSSLAKAAGTHTAH